MSDISWIKNLAISFDPDYPGRCVPGLLGSRTAKIADTCPTENGISRQNYFPSIAMWEKQIHFGLGCQIAIKGFFSLSVQIFN